MEEDEDDGSEAEQNALADGNRQNLSHIPHMDGEHFPNRQKDQSSDGTYGEEETQKKGGDRLIGRRERANPKEDDQEGCSREEGRENDAKEEGGHCE